jgi:hypothetical protein
MGTITAMRRLVVLAMLICGLAGCGGGSESSGRPSATATAEAAASATPSPAAADAAPKSPMLLYAWRNFEETGIPEEATIYTDGTVRYRNLLHTQNSIKVFTRRLAPSQLVAIRGLVGKIDLAHADASGETPRRDGYRWVLRRHGVVGTAADGHVQGTLGQLVKRLSALMDRLRSKSL